MTSLDLTTRLDFIKSACRQAIELGEKATKGPWEDRTKTTLSDVVTTERGTEDICFVDACDNDPHNASFIVHSRTFAPLAARALLTAIEGLEKASRDTYSEPRDKDEIPPTAWEDRPTWRARDALDALQAIASQWEVAT